MTKIASFTIRSANDSDHEGLAALISGCFAEYADEGVQFDPDGLDADLKAWASGLAAEGGAGWVALDDAGGIVGCAGYVQTSETVFELKRLYVAEAFRGQRVAVKLLERAERAAFKAGGEVLVAWSDSRFKRGHSFYRREGFIQLDDTRDLGDISNTTENHFVKAL